MDYEIVEFAEYNALLADRQKLADDAASASEYTRGLFESGVEEADLRLAALREDPQFIAKINALCAPVQQAFRELEGLQSAVESGLIPEESIVTARLSLEERIATNPDLRFAMGLYAATAAVAETVEVSHEPTPNPDIPASEVAADVISPVKQEKQPQSITITYKGTAIQIGEHGKYIKMSNRAHDGQRDYSQERIKILEVLINHNGSMVKANDVWDEAFPGKPYDRNAMAQLRSWIKQLTFRRQPIVHFNQKRGLGSAYGILDFDVTYVRKANIVIPQSTETEPVPTAPAQSAAVAEAAESQPEAITEDTSYFPLTSYECLVVSEFLLINNKILEQLGLLRLEQMVVKELRQIPTEDAQKEMITAYGSVPDARRVFLKKLQALFEDEERLWKAVDKMPTDDARFGIFEYLFEMEGAQRWDLITKLVDAEHELDIDILAGKRDGYIVQDVRRTTTIDGVCYTAASSHQPTDETQAALKSEADAVGAEITVPEDRASEVRTEDSSPDGDLEELNPRADNTPEEQPAPATAAKIETPPTTTPDLTETSVNNWEKDFKHEIGEAIQQLKEDGLMQPELVAAKIVSRSSSSNKLGTEESLRRLMRAGIIKRLGRGNPADYQMDAELIVTSYLLNQHQRGVLGKHSKNTQKRALELISEAVQSYFAKVADS